MPPSDVGGFGTESDLLLSEALDVFVDSALKLGLDLVSLDHLNNLLLLFIYGTVFGTDFPQALVDIVVKP